MNDVHDYGDAVLVSLVDERLQILWCAEARRSCEERAYVIAERSVVRMLFDSHNLYAVVTVCLNARQHVLAELVVCAHLLCILRHAYMALVYEQRRLVRLERLLLPFVRLRVPHLRREYLCILVLHNACSPSRDAFAHAAVPVYVHLEEVTVLHCLCGQFQLPVASLVDAFCFIFFVFFPIVEVAHKVDFLCVRCPLAEHPSTCSLVQAIIFVSVGKICQLCLSIIGQYIQFPQGVFVSAAYSVLVRLQIGVVLHKSDVLYSRFLHSLCAFCLCCHS